MFGRQFDGNGAAQSSQFRLNVFATSNQEEPQGAAIGDGRWVAVWQSLGQDGSGRGVVGRIFGGGDVGGGEEFVVNTNIFGVQERPVVAGLKDGGFVVAWQSAFQDGPGYGVFAQRYAADGTRIGDEFRVNTITAGQQQAPAIVGLPDGGFFIAWETESLDGDGFAIAGRRFDAAGLAAAPEFQINTTTASNQTDPHLMLTATGGLVVTWESNGQDGSGTAVVAQRFNPNFTRNGGEIVANTFQTFFQENPASVATPSGFVTLWQTFGKESGTGIYAQEFASSDTLPVFRFYNFATGGHFYTAGADERDHIRANIDTFVYEGVAFGVAAQPATGTAPLWRFYNSATGTHFYTISIKERVSSAPTTRSSSTRGRPSTPTASRSRARSRCGGSTMIAPERISIPRTRRRGSSSRARSRNGNSKASATTRSPCSPLE
ncbi:MAG: hypothetical protein FJX67_05750 [Alphaproteobacteria bacterium]|nr:hypothetical protein [Alphaproteobacteria bacterium]